MFTFGTALLFILLIMRAKDFTVPKSDYYKHVLVSLLFAEICGFWINLLTECTQGALYCLWAYIATGFITLACATGELEYT